MRAILWKLPAALTVVAVMQATPLHAQSRGRLDAASDALDAKSDALDAQNDALLATPNAATPQPVSDLYATAPGQEQQVRRQNFRLNLLTPFGYNSNAEDIRRGGTSTFEIVPLGRLSWSAPVGDLPLRASAGAGAESDRYFSASHADLDKLGSAARLQYVNSGDDQAYSPYVAVARRWDFLPTFDDQISARQDFNFGFNKRFNMDADLRPIPIAADTSAATVWSFGLTAFVQRRLREPQASSTAVFIIPSLTYAISRDWNASFAVELLNRAFDRNALGLTTQIQEFQPIATLEYVVPAESLGGERSAAWLGRPAFDLQTAWLKVWSNAPGGGYDQFMARAVVKLGWRF